MKKLSLLALLSVGLMALQACTSTTVTTSSGAKISRQTFATNHQFGKLDIRQGTNSVTVEGYQSSQDAAGLLKAAVEGAVQGAGKAAAGGL